MSRRTQIDPARYARTRNFISGAVSYLSPFISRGVISLPHVAKTAVDQALSTESAEKF